MTIFPLRLIDLLIAGQLYVILAVGGIGLEGDHLLNRLTIFLIGIMTILAFYKQLYEKSSVIVLFFTVAAYLLLKALFSGGSDVALGKIDGLVFSLGLASMLANILVRRAGNRSYQCIIVAGLVILFCTVLYKLNFGFFERNVRYFLNGSIVFGWMMAWLMLLTFYSQYRSSSKLIFSVMFFLAVLWSYSRGPIIALSIFLILAALPKKLDIRKVLVIGFICSSLFGIFFYGIDNTNLIHPRVSRAAQLLFDPNKSDLLFILGSRYEQWIYALTLFQENPLFGIGMGNFELNTSVGYLSYYPHNIFLELLSEHGLFGLLFFLLLFLLLFRQTDHPGMLMGLFFLAVMSISGDLGYLRIPIFILYLGGLIKNV